MAIGTQEWLLILVAILLLFGASSIPKLARSLGRAKGEFEKSRREFDTEMAKASTDAGAPGGSGKPGAVVAPAVDEAAVRRSARDLGIEDKGKSVDELKSAIRTRLG